MLPVAFVVGWRLDNPHPFPQDPPIPWGGGGLMGFDHDHGRGAGGGTRNLEHICLRIICVVHSCVHSWSWHTDSYLGRFPPCPCFPHPSAHQDRSNNYTTQQEHPNLGRPPTTAAREASGRSKSDLKKPKPHWIPSPSKDTWKVISSEMVNKVACKSNQNV